MKSEVIVTGGAGFIGANIVKSLLQRDVKVHVFDNLSTGNKENLPLNQVEFHNIDLKTNYKIWPKINASSIYHFAANADVRGGLIDHDVDLK